MPRKKKMKPEDVTTPPAAESTPVQTAPSPKTREQLLVEWSDHIERGRGCYEAADYVFEELRKGMSVGDTITHPVTGEMFKLEDNFALKNKAWKSCGIARFELRAIKGTKRTK